MFPGPFAYERAESVAHAVELLGRHGEEARLLAGGQSLVPLMKLRVVSPGVLIDLNGIAGLDWLRLDDDWLSVGPLVRHAHIETSGLIGREMPLMREAVRSLADVQVRNRGTVAGSLAEADPAGDWGPVLMAMGAEVHCQGTATTRVIALDDFFVDYLTPDLRADEMICELRVRRPPSARSGSSYLKFERRAGDFAVVAVAVQVLMAEDGTCTDIRIGLGGVGLTPVRPREAEEMLRGTQLGDAAIADAASCIQSRISPLDEVSAPSWYKRGLVDTFVARAITQAVGRANARS